MKKISTNGIKNEALSAISNYCARSEELLELQIKLQKNM